MGLLDLFQPCRKSAAPDSAIDLNVLYVTAREGLSHAHAQAIRQLILGFSPVEFEFLNPGSFVIFFAGTSEGRVHGAALADRLRQFAVSNAIGFFATGFRAGTCIRLAPQGSGFVGTVINEAMSAAIQEANVNAL